MNFPEVIDSLMDVAIIVILSCKSWCN
jgi:hypothetical protein